MGSCFLIIVSYPNGKIVNNSNSVSLMHSIELGFFVRMSQNKLQTPPKAFFFLSRCSAHLIHLRYCKGRHVCSTEGSDT